MSELLGPNQPVGYGDHEGPSNPLEAFSAYQGEDWSPARLAFHQNLETFADKVVLLVALQGSGKINQEQAFAQIGSLWKHLEHSKEELISSTDG